MFRNELFYSTNLLIGKTMKTFIATMTMLLLVAVGCNEQDNITSPEETIEQQEPNWLVSLPDKGFRLHKKHHASELIEGNKGGEVKLKDEIDGGPFGKIKVDSKLKANKNSFTGTLTISTEIDDSNLLTTFAPHYTFNEPLEYTLELEGVDLTGIDPDSVDFVYQAEDGSIHQCEYKSIKVELNKGKVKVDKAKLPHFSRYGFIKKNGNN